MHLRTVTAVLCLLASVGAQNRVCVTGVVRPVTGPTICAQGETHFLECTRVFLRSSTVSLRQFEGRNVRIVGTDTGLVCPVIDVRSVAPPPATLDWCGSGSTGCPIKLVMCPGGLGRGAIFLASQPAYVPLGCAQSPFQFLDGTFLIGGAIVPVFSGGLSACAEVTLRIPLDNALVGANVWAQGARQDVGPVGPLTTTNAICFRISPLLPPCAPLGC